MTDQNLNQYQNKKARQEKMIQVLETLTRAAKAGFLPNLMMCWSALIDLDEIPAHGYFLDWDNLFSLLGLVEFARIEAQGQVRGDLKLGEAEAVEAQEPQEPREPREPQEPQAEPVPGAELPPADPLPPFQSE